MRGKIALKCRLTPVWSHGMTFWANEPDDVDVPWLVRYRISPR